MITKTLVRNSRCATIVLILVGVEADGDITNAQSPIVFMTASYPTPSKLVRFDSGLESFAVTAGANAAFQGVTLLGGNVLVADYNGEKIQRYSPSGTLLSPFASFSEPTFLESDSSGNVYTTHFSIGPAFATRFNSAGAITQTFVVASSELSGIDADAAGNVYVADRWNSRLWKFAPTGTILTSIAIPELTDDIAIDELGNRLFLVNETLGASIKIFDISGASPVFTGSISAPPNANLVGVHFAPESGNVLAVDFGPASRLPRGLEFAPDGTLLRQYQPAGARLALDIVTFPIPEPTSFGMLCVLGILVSHLLVQRRRACPPFAQ